ncbi:MAG TPA: asparagine--tRNA ligase [Planctomycetes bacterium]|nr:asparagine--tRNA ligase [Planctomycetota bacterium]HIN79920.1 asparagine--tRNA ligase [Planctomycetota bacterium]
MTRTTVNHLGDHVGETVNLEGWLSNRRSSKKLHFLLLRDGSGTVQCVVSREKFGDEAFEPLGHIPYESSLTIEGVVKADARAQGGYELEATDVRVISEAQEYPISNKDHGPDFLLSHRHLWLRSRKQVALMRIRDEVLRAIRGFMHDREFLCIDAPIFTPNACEGTSTLFEVNYFDDETAFLTQSGQLYMEAAAMAYGKAYCLGPTFRAEKSKTRRHLTEFWMWEPEMAHSDLDDVMDLAEDALRTIVEAVLTNRGEDLEVLKRDIEALERVREPFPRISYTEAVEKMHEKGHEFEWGGDFGARDEALISSLYPQPVLIHRYPQEVKAFYMKRDPQDDRLALGVDVLAPEGYGEVIGGGQREDDLDLLQGRLRAHGLSEEAFAWYLDLRRYGSVPHGGFGLGIERTVCWIAGIEHVRECIPFPRMLYRIYP